MKNLILPTVAALVIATLALTVWLTRYGYVHGNGMNGVPYALRVDRWTGRLMRLNFNAGWYDPKLCGELAAAARAEAKPNPPGFDWPTYWLPISCQPENSPPNLLITD